METFRKDSMWLGILIGTVCPAIVLAILYGLSVLLAPEGVDFLVPLQTLILVSIFPNLFTLRYYLVKLKYDRTGRGILLVTFIFSIIFFFLVLKVFA